MEEHESLAKAFKKGVRGKFRRVDGGKVKFIRSHDGKVEKDVTSSAGMAADFGSPSAEVLMTDKPKVKDLNKAGCACDCECCVKGDSHLFVDPNITDHSGSWQYVGNHLCWVTEDGKVLAGPPEMVGQDSHNALHTGGPVPTPGE